MERERPVPEPEEAPSDSGEHSTPGPDQNTWDAALNNPDARAFMSRILRRAKELDDKGLIHRP